MDWTTVALAVVGAAVYGIIFFFKAWMTQEPRPPFDTYKFGATLIVAIVIGVIAGMTGVPLSEADFLTQIVEYGFYVAMVETILKAIFGSIWPTQYPDS